MDDLRNWEIPEYDDSMLESILAEFGAPAGERPAPKAEEPPVPEAAPQESIADRSRRLVMSALGETLRQYREQNPTPQPQEDEPPAAGSAAENAPAEPEAAPEADDEAQAAEPEDAPRADGLASQPMALPLEPEQPRRPRFSMGEDGIITLIYDSGEPEDEPEAEAETPDEPDSEAEAPAAEEEKSEPAEAPRRTRPRRPRAERAPLAETLLGPFIRIAAARQAMRQQREKEAGVWPEPDETPDTPELSPRKASRYYAIQSKRIRTRFRVSLGLTLILAWIALGFPMAGMLGQSTALQAGASLVLTLAVMLAALDVVTAGLRQLCDLTPGAEALAFLSALLSCADAALVLFGYGTVMPFCAVGAAALTAALLGERLRCLALMRTFRTAAEARDPTFAAADGGPEPGARRLHRAERDSIKGFVRRSEGQDICRSAYQTAAPIILLAALVLAVIASLGGKGGNFLHTLSALISVGTSFAAFFGFSLPYSVTARRLRASGAAVAGFAGCADIAGAKQLVLTDSDLFPPGTMKFTAINILEGVPQQRVINAACSLIFAAGGGLEPLFRELAERRGSRVPEPREYTLHESGGLSGIVNGEHAEVGPARFMNLQGVRLPQNIPPKNTVCVALGGELVGVFVIEYTPTTSVQDALVTLLRGRITPVFAVRDFNITPKMIHDLFKLPSVNFNFPSYRDRVRIRPDDAAPVSAVIKRRGMLPLVETAEAGHRLYSGARLITVLSLIGSVIGMAIVFLLCRTEAFDTAGVRNVLSFMFLWALPAALLAYGRGK